MTIGRLSYSHCLAGTPLRSVVTYRDGTRWRYLICGWWWRCAA